MDQSAPVSEGLIEGEIRRELVEAHRKIIKDEARLKLVLKLLESKLCTRDIYSFACSQADRCETVSDLNWTMVKNALHTKIRDISQTLKIDHRRKRIKEKELLECLGGRSWALRSTIRHIKSELGKEKDEIARKYEKKLLHYKTTMTRLEAAELKK